VFEKQVASVGESIHKGETNSRRCRRNGYVFQPNPTPHHYYDSSNWSVHPLAVSPRM